MQKQNRDIVREAISLFQQLQQRRNQLQVEIGEIDQALAQVRGEAPASVVKAPVPTASRRGRGSNALSLREAVLQVLAGGPKTKEEILAGASQVGYRFAASNPMNSLQTFLYGTGKHLLQRAEGKFSLGGGAAAAGSASPKPAKAKRTMSAAARRRISEAVKARWARQKAGSPAKTASSKPAKAKKPLSAEARKRISDAVKARWAKQKAGSPAKSASPKPAKVKRTMSAEARQRISDAVKARWAKQKAAQT